MSDQSNPDGDTVPGFWDGLFAPLQDFIEETTTKWKKQIIEKGFAEEAADMYFSLRTELTDEDYRTLGSGKFRDFEYTDEAINKEKHDREVEAVQRMDAFRHTFISGWKGYEVGSEIIDSLAGFNEYLDLKVKNDENSTLESVKDLLNNAAGVSIMEKVQAENPGLSKDDLKKKFAEAVYQAMTDPNGYDGIIVILDKQVLETYISQDHLFHLDIREDDKTVDLLVDCDAVAEKQTLPNGLPADTFGCIIK